MSSLHILNIGKYFSYFIDFFFNLLMASFAVQKLFSWMKPYVFIFYFVACGLGFQKKSFPCQGGFFSCFLPGVSWFQVLYLCL